jgi:DNA repair exonuclease SbcCD ATPase subunit
MGILDQLSKTLSQGVDRAKFEAEKFQKTTKLQGEVNELQRQLNEKMVELGQRAYNLQRAGQINIPSIAQLARDVDKLQAQLVNSEEELKAAQAEVFPEPPSYTPTPGTSSAQSVPISVEQPSPSPQPYTAPTANPQKTCPTCGFQMPGTALFCPNCGARVGT